MNIEGFNYTLVTTVLGMLVVFASLTLLSLLMVGLKAAFGERAGADRTGGERIRGKRGAGSRAAAGGKPEVEASGAGASRGRDRKGVEQLPTRPGADEERQAPPWLTAAVAAYLAATEGGGPSADPWLPDFNHFDPWLTPGRSTRSRGAGTTE
jgi:hypothetical protein